MTKQVAITGGIGSGKSKVMRYLEDLGYPVYYSDQGGKKVMNDPLIQKQIQEIFEENVLINGVLDRKKIASIVFNDSHKLKKLNNIIHPAVAKDYEDFVKINKEKEIVFYESAILIESGNYTKFKDIVLITAPKEVRIERVMKRDGISEEEVLERMKNQLSDEKKMKYVNYILENKDFDKTKKKMAELLLLL